MLRVLLALSVFVLLLIPIYKFIKWLYIKFTNELKEESCVDCLNEIKIKTKELKQTVETKLKENKEQFVNLEKIKKGLKHE